MMRDYGFETDLINEFAREDEKRDTEWRAEIAKVLESHPNLADFLQHVERLTSLLFVLSALEDCESYDFGDDHDKIRSETYSHVLWFFTGKP